ncbi:hypothetical protein BDV25DRAFT_167166 [Aspergillus avenaceus]|uniref:Uncharacterized protein n=1 Tax=Aspergillus avenaceus TaxID=36643 RepID=A0A5N6TD34_ASPAV|nr:hypothetical protein BDV25DRAFT_167166 [Aspergillus avenaceus]
MRRLKNVSSHTLKTSRGSFCPCQIAPPAEPESLKALYQTMAIIMFSLAIMTGFHFTGPGK